MKEKKNENFSVFDNPLPKKEQRKRLSRASVLLICILAAAALAGAFLAAVKLRPAQGEQSSSSLFGTFKIVDISKESIAQVTVVNEHGTFAFLPETETAGSEESSYEMTKWFLENSEKEKNNTTSNESVVSAAATVSVMREITEKSAADCGLQTPECSVEVITRDKKSYTLLIGASSPDGYGVYVKTKANDAIYLADETVLQSFDFSLDELMAE